MSQDLYDKILECIGNNELLNGISMLSNIDKVFHATTLQRFNDLEYQSSKGLLSQQEYSLEKNRLLDGIMKFLEAWKITISKQEVKSQKIKKPKASTPMFGDAFLKNLEKYLRTNPNHAYIEMKLDILSLEYLRRVIKRLEEVQRNLEPRNFQRLINALDELKDINSDLIDILEKSNNKNSLSYEAALIVKESYEAIRGILITLPEDDYQLKIGTSKLERAIIRLIRRIKEKEVIALPFSPN